MQNFFLILSFLMGVVVLASNYLVQFPFEFFGFNEILTYGAFSYPIAFLITDLANRSYGKIIARKIVYIGFVIGVLFTLFFSTNFRQFKLDESAIEHATVREISRQTVPEDFRNKRVHRCWRMVRIANS